MTVGWLRLVERCSAILAALYSAVWSDSKTTWMGKRVRIWISLAWGPDYSKVQPGLGRNFKEGEIMSAGYLHGGAKLWRGVLIREGVRGWGQSGDDHPLQVTSAPSVEDLATGLAPPPHSPQHLCTPSPTLTVPQWGRVSHSPRALHAPWGQGIVLSSADLHSLE